MKNEMLRVFSSIPFHRFNFNGKFPKNIYKFSTLPSKPQNTPIYQTHSFPHFQLTILGSGGSLFSRHRNQPSLHFFLGGEGWIFDCGEGAVLKNSHPNCPNLAITNKIFITHLHPDHISGLIPMIIHISTLPNHEPLVIYGPQGLHHFIAPTLRIVSCSFRRDVVINELIVKPKDVLKSFTWGKNFSSFCYPAYSFSSDQLNIQVNQISSKSDGLWTCFADHRIRVRAGLIHHRIPCFGFIVEETPTSGELLIERVKELGIDYRNFGLLKMGMDVQLPNGSIMRSADLTGPPIPGRKICILGDTSDASNLAEAAKDCDLLVHEAAFANEEEFQATLRGHSTPRMACRTALLFKAKRVVLNHIGAQYLPSYLHQILPQTAYRACDPKSDGHLYQQALKAFNRSHHLILARDMLRVSIPPGGYNPSPSDKEFDFKYDEYQTTFNQHQGGGGGGGGGSNNRRKE